MSIFDTGHTGNSGLSDFGANGAQGKDGEDWFASILVSPLSDMAIYRSLNVPSDVPVRLDVDFAFANGNLDLRIKPRVLFVDVKAWHRPRILKAISDASRNGGKWIDGQDPFSKSMDTGLDRYRRALGHLADFDGCIVFASTKPGKTRLQHEHPSKSEIAQLEVVARANGHDYRLFRWDDAFTPIVRHLGSTSIPIPDELASAMQKLAR